MRDGAAGDKPIKIADGLSRRDAVQTLPTNGAE